MTKEAYAIYMTVNKSTCYFTGQEITLRSDHSPLKKFLNNKTLNNTVDNWEVEIEFQNEILFTLQVKITSWQIRLVD